MTFAAKVRQIAESMREPRPAASDPPDLHAWRQGFHTALDAMIEDSERGWPSMTDTRLRVDGEIGRAHV